MKGNLRTTTGPIAPSELILRPNGSLYHIGLRNGDVADKVIIVGDPERVPSISALFESVDLKVSGREFVIHTGHFSGKRITVASSGIGVDNIDILVNELDAAVNINLETRVAELQPKSLEIVRIGTSGAMQAAIATGDFVASAYSFATDGVPYSYGGRMDDNELALHNSLKEKFEWLQFNPSHYTVSASDELLQRIAPDMHQGITATANGFYGPQGRSLRLQSEMESRIDSYAAFLFKGIQITNFEMESAGIYAIASMLGHRALTVCAILANRATKEFHNNPSASVESLVRVVLQRF